MQSPRRCPATELPPEILQHILDLSNAGRIRTLEAVDAAARGPRSEIWIRTSQVCKAWAAASQYLLTRDICVGSQTTKQRPDLNCEESSLPQLIQLLAALPDRSHVRFVQVELGSGWAFDSTKPYSSNANRYNGGLGIPWHLRYELWWVQLEWADPNLLPRLLHLCQSLQHLSLTVADPVLSPGNDMAMVAEPLRPDIWEGHLKTVLTNLCVLSFTYKSESSNVFVRKPVILLAQVLAIAPNVSILHVDTYFASEVESDEHPEAWAAAPVHLNALEQLYIKGFAPSFLFRSQMPRLDRLVWVNPDPRQKDLIPVSVSRLAVNGDWIQNVPTFTRLPQLRDVLVNGGDVWDGSSFHNEEYRAIGEQNKASYMRALLNLLPAGLESFTLVESFALRIVPRETLCSALMGWAEASSHVALPRTFKLLLQAGPLPAHYVRKEFAHEPLHTCLEFEAVQSLLVERGVQVVLGETDDPFSNFRFPNAL